MEAIKAIKTRRSIRKFTEDTVPLQTLQQITECGMYAPSAGNEQPWHFLLITEKKILEKIPQVHEHAKMFHEAAAGILICFDPTLEKHDKMAVQDCAAATQNILLAIHAHGLGGCWCGVYPRKHRMQGLKELLQIPEHIIPFSLIAVGIPNEDKDILKRYKSDRLHIKIW